LYVACGGLSSARWTWQACYQPQLLHDLSDLQTKRINGDIEMCLQDLLGISWKIVHPTYRRRPSRASYHAEPIGSMVDHWVAALSFCKYSRSLLRTGKEDVVNQSTTK
jgi:hypothetical protein